MPRIVEQPRSSSKWISVVAKILALTQSRKIQWIMSTETPGVSPAETVTHVYLAQFLNQRFRLYEYRYLAADEEGSSYWADSYRLEFVDDVGRPLYEVPMTPGIRDLLLAVKYQTTGIDKFLEQIDKLDVQGVPAEKDDIPF